MNHNAILLAVVILEKAVKDGSLQSLGSKISERNSSDASLESEVLISSFFCKPI